MANDGGWLLLNDEEKDEIINKDPTAKDFIKPFLGAKEFMSRTNRWCIWLDKKPSSTFKNIKPIMDRVKKVQEYRAASEREATKSLALTPFLFGEIRQPTGNYVLVPRHGSESRKYLAVGIFDSDTICGDHNMLVPNADLYTFGILSSLMHNAWLRTVGGRIKNDPRYSARIVYNNFPWPNPNALSKKKIEDTAKAIIEARAEHPDVNLKGLYHPTFMPTNLRKAHEANDRAVDLAYGKKKFTFEAERAGFLFELYNEKINS